LRANQNSFAFPAGVTIRGSIDPYDAEEIEKFDKLAGDGVYFTIVDGPNLGDATGLWTDMQEAMKRHPDAILETVLGRTVHALLFQPEISAGGIAFVDGGIETVLEGASEQCWNWFLERADKLWDTVDNPMLIWSHNPQRSTTWNYTAQPCRAD
jgi:hypothetical protein